MRLTLENCRTGDAVRILAAQQTLCPARARGNQFKHALIHLEKYSSDRRDHFQHSWSSMPAHLALLGEHAAYCFAKAAHRPLDVEPPLRGKWAKQRVEKTAPRLQKT